MLRRQPPLTYENALSRMAALCAKCEQCTPDLLKKMSSCGVSAGVAAKVISRLIELKFVDDRRFSKPMPMISFISVAGAAGKSGRDSGQNACLRI